MYRPISARWNSRYPLSESGDGVAENWRVVEVVDLELLLRMQEMLSSETGAVDCKACVDNDEKSDRREHIPILGSG